MNKEDFIKNVHDIFSKYIIYPPIDLLSQKEAEQVKYQNRRHVDDKKMKKDRTDRRKAN